MYAEGNPRELMKAGDGAEDGEIVDQDSRQQLIEQIMSKIQKAKPQFTDEDVCLWSKIGTLCKDIQFHNQETARKEDALEKLLESTPLNYSFRKVAEHVVANSPGSASSQSQGEQQPDDGVAAPKE